VSPDPSNPRGGRKALMAEVPEHLLRRAAERKAALEAKKKAEAGGGEPEEAGPAAPAAAAGGPGGLTADEIAASNAEAEQTGKIPAHLLARSAAARSQAGGAGGAPRPRTATA